MNFSPTSVPPPADDVVLRLLLEQGKEHALIVIDTDGVIRSWLMGASRIFGYEPGEIVGLPTDRLFTAEDRARGVPAAELRLATENGRAEDDRWMLRRDGVQFWASGLVYCLRGPSGEVAAFAKILRDRTDQRGQVEALANRAEALAAQDRRRMIALGTLAHELRNPLGVLANGAQLLQMTQSDDERVAYVSQLIERQLKYITRLVDDLLDLVRVQSGKAMLELERVDLRAELEAAAEIAAATTKEKGQRVQIFCEQSIHLDADSARLRQVLVNLIANAARYSPEGTTIRCKASIEGNEAVVRVEDEGTGIPPDSLPHIFDVFSQAEPPSGGRSAGLGLGLSIVKEYVELHGGTVQVRSEGIGRGSEFTVRLPLRQPRVEPG